MEEQIKLLERIAKSLEKIEANLQEERAKATRRKWTI